MKKIKNMPILILVFMLIFSIGFFISTKEKVVCEDTKADIIGVSGEVINLTNLQGYQPTHYFTDNNNQSTLQATRVEENKKTYYYNENGQKVSTYYALEGDSPVFSKKNSYGVANYYLSEDMKYFASQGALYVQASAGVVSRDFDGNDFVEISISSGTNFSSFYSDHTQLNNEDARPKWQKTEFIQVDPNSIISFTFSSLGAGNTLNPCDFEIYEPKIIFKIVIDKVSILNEITDLNPGQAIKLQGSNLVVDREGESNYLKYYRSIFKVNYQITSGEEFATIIDNYLYINENIDSNQIIKIRAQSQRDSLSGGYIYSEEISFNIITQKYQVNIESDFLDPAEYYGEGEFFENEKIVLRAVPKEGFRFVSWIINDEEIFTENVFYQVKAVNKIKCNFVKEIRVEKILAETKIYDGNLSVNSYQAVFDGVEPSHQVILAGMNLEHLNINAGENKEVKILGDSMPVLQGEDALLYELDLSSFPQYAFGTILKKDIIVKACATSKIYGDKDSIIKYETDGLVDKETLLGSLSRQQGETVGAYDILIGDLEIKNTNYQIEFLSDKYTITAREIFPANLSINEKVYDKTTTAIYSYDLGNVLANDDIQISLKLEFPTVNAGTHEMRIMEYSLAGEDSFNYILKPLDEIYGIIKQRQISVTADPKVAIYGEEEELTYIVEGLLDGDQLFGSLSREEGKDVGIYSILKNNLSNPNYEINFISSSYEIIKRPLTVMAQEVIKTYGDDDPALLYDTDNLVDGDYLNGSLTRAIGEDVGEYEILLGTVNNKNYEISFIGNKFIIKKRTVTLSINVEDKVYDGTTDLEWSYSFENVPKGREFSVEAYLRFEDKEAGDDKKVVVENLQYHIQKIENYSILFDEESVVASIFKKDVRLSIDDVTKIYGEEDPEFTYSVNGVIDKEELVFNLTRKQGQDVGEYEILSNVINEDVAKNYNIINNEISYLTILPKEVEIIIDDCLKVFGEPDPILTYNLLNEDDLAYDDTFDQVFSGQPQRDEGEIPGIYKISQGSISSQSNYKIVEVFDGLLQINKRKVLLKADEISKVYGDEDPLLTFTAENLVEGEEINLKLKREYGEDVGKYVITYTSLSDPRYEITFVQSTLTILPRDITVKADDMFKVYGNDDPKFTASVTEGALQFDDVLSQIQTGEMHRSKGEDVGEYSIVKGTYTLGKNYNLSFESGILTVLPAEIEVKANDISKKYGNEDGLLTFVISNGSLKFSDGFEGSLTREEGEDIGQYAISQGSLKLNDNYILTFIPAVFVIEKRPISIIADAITKVYGEEDPVFTYRISGELVKGDELEGCLYRERGDGEDKNVYEMAGKYLINSTLNNEKYEISYIENYLTIKQREVFISANNVSITYGEEEPELTYEITAGTILEGDIISGSIYRVEGKNAGRYDIRSNLTLGRNYKIVFTKGIFEIKPIDIYVKTYNYEKTYGDINPEFEYEIVKGELLEGDKLLGGITKTEGEDVGVYRLLSAFNNTNYNVILTENYITIKPKNVYLSVSIHDKVYDGGTTAYIKQAVVSGLIDENIKISYDKENSARFVSNLVGNNIEVNVFNIYLEGEKSQNYNLVYPENVFGNITNNLLTEETFGVSMSTSNNTALSYGTKLSVQQEKLDRGEISNNKELVASYNISLSEAGEKRDLTGIVTLRFEITNQFKGRNNYYVYFVEENGEKSLLKCKTNGTYLEVNVDKLGEFIILTDNELWLDISAYISIGLLGVMSIWLTYYIVKRKIKNKKR